MWITPAVLESVINDISLYLPVTSRIPVTTQEPPGNVNVLIVIGWTHADSNTSQGNCYKPPDPAEPNKRKNKEMKKQTKSSKIL